MIYNKLKQDTYFKISFFSACGNSSANAQNWTANTKHKTCIGKRNFGPYTFENFKPNQFFIGFDFVSSRLGSAFSSNAIKQDSYLLSGSWHFNKNKAYHFVTRLNAGYFYSDLEKICSKKLNTAFLFSPEIGFHTILKLPISLNVGTGYYIIAEKDGYSPEPYSHSTFTLIFITPF
jgi:CRISPR/Cas system-associated protein Csx1